ncbi:ribosome recycling factor [Patescibacteria group bacterium]|nr:MAG: ribosome recycling factor [Patescibacteria group bacterium]
MRLPCLGDRIGSPLHWMNLIMNLSDHKPRFDNVVAHLKKELGALRTGRANPAVLDTVKVETYGSMMDIKSLASVSVPDAATLMIEPWDASVVKDIEKGIIAANIGLNPTVDGKRIRISLPKMTEENRKDLVKVVGHKAEEAKVSLRGLREELRNEIIEAERDGKMSEDGRFRAQDELEKLVKSYMEQLEKIEEEKEKDIMTI